MTIACAHRHSASKLFPIQRRCARIKLSISSMHWPMRRFNATSELSKYIKSQFHGLGSHQYPQLQHSNLALPALHGVRHNLRNSLAKTLQVMPIKG